MKPGEAMAAVKHGWPGGQIETQEEPTCFCRRSPRENLVAAWKRVKANSGSAGVDGLSVRRTAEHLSVHWPQVREQLLDDSYRPRPVRRVQIPKPGGGVRELGIPTVTDRLIQQALLQPNETAVAIWTRLCKRLRAICWAGRRTSGRRRRHGVMLELDGWLRHRLRALQLNQWRRGRTVYRALRTMEATHL